MSTARTLSFTHHFEPGSRPGLAPLLLLHGTGGDETDLLPIGRRIAPGAALLSPRGKVLEGGMPRFFRRLSEGVFDEEDVRRRAHDLADFVKDARQTYDLRAPIAVGFSNGANIAAAMLMLRPGVLEGAALIRAMVPLQNPPGAELAGTRVLVLSGAMDPIVPAPNAGHLVTMLADSGADVRQDILPTGHGLTVADLDIARAWIDAAPKGQPEPIGSGSVARTGLRESKRGRLPEGGKWPTAPSDEKRIRA